MWFITSAKNTYTQFIWKLQWILAGHESTPPPLVDYTAPDSPNTVQWCQYSVYPVHFWTNMLRTCVKSTQLIECGTLGSNWSYIEARRDTLQPMQHAHRCKKLLTHVRSMTNRIIVLDATHHLELIVYRSTARYAAAMQHAHRCRKLSTHVRSMTNRIIVIDATHHLEFDFWSVGSAQQCKGVVHPLQLWSLQ